jgi:hypothetical protein
VQRRGCHPQQGLRRALQSGSRSACCSFQRCGCLSRLRAASGAAPLDSGNLSPCAAAAEQRKHERCSGARSTKHGAGSACVACSLSCRRPAAHLHRASARSFNTAPFPPHELCVRHATPAADWASLLIAAALFSPATTMRLFSEELLLARGQALVLESPQQARRAGCQWVLQRRLQLPAAGAGPSRWAARSLNSASWRAGQPRERLPRERRARAPESQASAGGAGDLGLWASSCAPQASARRASCGSCCSRNQETEKMMPSARA